MSLKPASRRARLVVKIGTSLLTRRDGHLDKPRMGRLASELSAVQKSGTQVILVSSGAIAAGLSEMGWTRKPSELAKKQAAAAVGQPRLMETYRRFFRRRGISVAQLLLTRDDFESPLRSRNARTTILTLLHAGVIPIINENDTVAVEEIRLGDNDTLAARVAVRLQADLLVLLTDVEGLMTRHPREGRGTLIGRVERLGARIEALAHAAPGSDGGTGGMQTKIRAARRAVSHGVPMVIASGKRAGVLKDLLAGRPRGTFFPARRRSSEKFKIGSRLDRVLANH